MEPHVRFRPPSSPPPPEWCEPYLVFRSDRLPPLPPVVEPATLELALTHKTAIPRAELDELDPLVREGNDLRTNRRFDWEGDAWFTWLVTEELVKRFPLANPGDLSVSYDGLCTLRQRIISNKTLSHLAWSYGFGTAIRATLDPSRARASVEHQKVVADAFEAYLAAALRPCGDDSRWDLLRSYVRSLLDPECAEGLVEFAIELRTGRLAGAPKHVVLPVQPESSKKTAQHTPQPTERSEPSEPNVPAASPANITWVEKPIHNGWIANITIGGRILASGRATKLLEARRRAETHLLNRLEGHPPTREFLLTAPEALEEVE